MGGFSDRESMSIGMDYCQAGPRVALNRLWCGVVFFGLPRFEELFYSPRSVGNIGLKCFEEQSFMCMDDGCEFWWVQGGSDVRPQRRMTVVGCKAKAASKDVACA